MGCQIAQNLCAITTPCTPFWLVHRYWGIILGLPCLPFATSLHNNPALSQCLHVAVLCHSEENDTAFQTHLKDKELSQTLQYTFKIYIYIYLYIYIYIYSCSYIYIIAAATNDQPLVDRIFNNYNEIDWSKESDILQFSYSLFIILDMEYRLNVSLTDHATFPISKKVYL